MKKIFESVEEWQAEGVKIFDTEDKFKWAFKCPACGRRQEIEEFREYKDKGLNTESAATECLGRYTGGRNGPHGCDWASYGLFRGPVLINDNDKQLWIFQFWLGNPK